MNDELTTKQRIFCKAYLSNGFNATQAAITAGYSENCAQEIGSENLTKPLIKEFIEKHIEQIEQKFDITFEKKLKALWKIVEAAQPKEAQELHPSLLISAIGELNKMQGHYKQKEITEDRLDEMQDKLNQLVEQNKKDY